MISIFYCEHFGTEQFSFNNKRPPAELRIKDISLQCGYGHYFTFIAQKGENKMVKCKMHPGLKQLDCTANTITREILYVCPH